MDIGSIKPREITDELKDSYLDYAMSVIVARALPDVRDGLKPVQRRILFAMHGLGLGPQAKLRKSATVVGEVLGKYHPHGDSPVYDAMVRLAQDFSLRYPLVQGQGNFGSLDGDSPAAMRYTEARLTPIAAEMLADIDRDTVDFVDTYDGTRKEPTVLPAKVPQLLLNGTVGIAVGMATNIPPHNLGEVVDALTYLTQHRSASVEELLQFVKGPDFPTGGAIYSVKDIAAAYGTGRGAILTRGLAEIVEGKGSAPQIVISSIPFQVNKATLIEHLAELVQEKKIEGIRDIRDESDRDGLRVAIDLKTDAFPQKVLNSLYKYTDLQKTFHMNMLALVDGMQPQVLSLKGMLEEYLKHREVIVRRRAEFDLTRARERAHILEGLVKALDQIDAVIAAIRRSRDRESAQQALTSKFGFTDLQASAILDMRLQTLAGLEQEKVREELKEKRKLMKELTLLLADPKRILDVIRDELAHVKEKYCDERKTKVVAHAPGEIKEEDLVPEEESLVILTRGGSVKRMNPAAYRTQKRGGKGVIGVVPKEEDVVMHAVSAHTHANLLFFTNTGKVFQTKTYEIPEASRQSRGKAIENFLALGPGEAVTAILPYRVRKHEPIGAKFFVMGTASGIIKKTAIEEFLQVRRSGLIAIKLGKGDVLRWVRASSGTDEVMLVTRNGQAIRFSERDVRAMGRPAGGVAGIRLRKGDEVVGMEVITKKGEAPMGEAVLVVTENGYGKRTYLKEYKKQKRAGVGVKTAKVTKKTGPLVVAAVPAPEAGEMIALSAKGQVIRTPIEKISILGRATQGVRLMKVEAGDRVAAATVF
ncbi:DNA gyrase subunit A [Candidatus Parcubacteria bacterium]|nr:DNA gyrase subunit A [Candidatus Parcubacteria bacterium]